MENTTWTLFQCSGFIRLKKSNAEQLWKFFEMCKVHQKLMIKEQNIFKTKGVVSMKFKIQDSNCSHSGTREIRCKSHPVFMVWPRTILKLISGSVAWSVSTQIPEQAIIVYMTIRVCHKIKKWSMWNWPMKSSCVIL